MKKMFLMLCIMQLDGRSFAIIENATKSPIEVALGLKAYGWAVIGNNISLNAFDHAIILNSLKNAGKITSDTILSKGSSPSYYKLEQGRAIIVDTNVYCPDQLLIKSDSGNIIKRFEASESCNSAFVIQQDATVNRYSIDQYDALKADQEKYYGFSYFTDTIAKRDGVTGLHIAASKNGNDFFALTSDDPLYEIKKADGTVERVPFPLIGQKVFRDPSIVRGADGTYHMVWSASWGKDDGGGAFFGYSSSKDLLTWTMPKLISLVNVPEENKVIYWGSNRASQPLAALGVQTVKISGLEDAVCAWAPEVLYLEKEKQFIIILTSKNNQGLMKLYYIMTKNFNDLEGKEANLLFAPNYNVIDGTILQHNNNYYLVYKNEDSKKLFIAEPQQSLPTKEKPEAWTADNSKLITSQSSYNEGPSVEKIGNSWVVYYDHYFGAPYLPTQHYDAMQSADLETWSPYSIRMPSGARHGSIFTIDRATFRAFLLKKTII